MSRSASNVPRKTEWWVRAISLGLALLVASVAFFRPAIRTARAAPNVTIQVNPSTTYQKLEGFGEAEPSALAATLTDRSLRAVAIEKAYGEVGINMGTLGTAVESPGSYDQRQNDNTDPFSINWAGFHTSDLDDTRHLLVDLARPFGFTGYYLGAEGPNVRWGSPWLAPIRRQNYDQFLDEAAEQVLANVAYWKNTYGEEPAYFQLGNEQATGNRASINPDLSGFGTVDVTQQVVDLVKRAGLRLRQAGFQKIKFMVGTEETEETSYQMASAILADPEASQYVGAIGYHTYPYGSGYSSVPFILSTSGAGAPDVGRIAIRNRIRDLAARHNIGAWLTENSHGGVGSLSYDTFRARAIHIHDEFVYANASAYFGENAMWDTASQLGHFGNTDIYSGDNEGDVVLINNRTGQVDIAGIGYAIGHYARWAKPGSLRVDAQSSDPLVQVTAFRDDAAGRLVLVVINNSIASTMATLNVNGTISGDVAGEQSTPGAYWTPLASFTPPSGNAFQISLPALSVTSLAANLSATVPPAGNLSLNPPGGANTVGQSWQLTLTGAFANTPFTICAVKDGAPVSCTPNFGSTDSTGSWTISGNFDASSVGAWTEWLQFPSGAASNRIAFTVSPGSSPALSINGAVSGTYQVGQSWTLALSGGPPNSVFDLCYTIGDAAPSCLGGFGTTSPHGAWTLSGTFDSASAGVWTEWLQFSSGSVSNRISFTVQ